MSEGKQIAFLGYFHCQGAPSPPIEAFIHDTIVTDDGEWEAYIAQVRAHPDKKDVGVMDIWSKPAGMSGPDAPDYWEYFGARFVEYATVSPGMSVLDVGCGTGSSLFPAAERVRPGGRVVGVDICEH